MKIHREGHRIILNVLLLSAVLTGLAFFFLPDRYALTVGIVLLALWFLIVRFFRVPHRPVILDDNTIYAPADGEVVVVERTFEEEYLREERIQVSVFMSIWNIHINWYPMSGVVEYFKHHHGRFLVAWHPKSSTENERTTTVIRGQDGRRILFRQIAGFVARRIVSYAEEGEPVRQNTECGFIKFGSRVDLFLPLESEVQVKLGDKVAGTRTVIAKLNPPAHEQA